MSSASSQRFIYLAVFCLMTPWVSLVYSRCEYQGMIQRLGIRVCQEGETHFIEDPCTGEWTYLESAAFNLDDYACQNVVIDGPGVAHVDCLGCDIVGVQTIESRAPSCVIQPRDLSVYILSGDTTWLQWAYLPCADRYDIIRGSLPGLSASGSGVSLGPVSCIVNNHPYVSTFQGPWDTTVPAPGHSYFYLVRGQGSLGVTPYGLSSAGLEEFPDSGGCPL